MCVKPSNIHQETEEKKRTEKAVNCIVSLFVIFIFRQIFTTLSRIEDVSRETRRKVDIVAKFALIKESENYSSLIKFEIRGSIPCSKIP